MQSKIQLLLLIKAGQLWNTQQDRSCSEEYSCATRTVRQI